MRIDTWYRAVALAIGVAVARPGFINFTLSDEWLQDQVDRPHELRVAAGKAGDGQDQGGEDRAEHE